MKEPKIRFKGFRGEWEIDKIGNFSTSFSGGTPTAGISAYYGGNIPFIRSGEIHEDKTELSLTEKGYNNSSAKIVEKGTLLYALYGATSGDVAISKIRGAINQAILAIIPYKSVEKVFLANFLLCNKDKIVGELLQGGQGNLSGSIVKDINVTYPCLSEQRAIASYFQHLDSLIQSTTKKIESLKQVKAASLQSMFPQEGETTPRVRFKGFEEEWEIVTLGEVGTFKSNGVDKLIKPNEKIINLLNYLDVYNSRQVTKDNCNSLMQVSASDRQIKECDIQKNDVFFTPSSETAEDIGYVLVMRDTLPNTCYSYHLMRYRPNEGVFFEDFPNCGFMTKFVRAQIRLLAKGVQRFVIGKTEFESIKVQIPSYKEQMQIANFFRSLDRQITLQTQRLEKLKQIKAACLDIMFV